VLYFRKKYALNHITSINRTIEGRAHCAPPTHKQIYAG
jgi:hypothetical protein